MATALITRLFPNCSIEASICLMLHAGKHDPLMLQCHLKRCQGYVGDMHTSFSMLFGSPVEDTCKMQWAHPEAGG